MRDIKLSLYKTTYGGHVDTNYRYDSNEDYAQAYGYTSAAEYAAARAAHDGAGTGHNPALCGDRCPCKARRDNSAAQSVSRAA